MQWNTTQLLKVTEIMPSEATWTDLERVILSEVRQGEISYDIPPVWDLRRNDTNELTKQKYMYG